MSRETAPKLLSVTDRKSGFPAAIVDDACDRSGDDRLAFLTDGVVAVIMTIMVLDMKPPAIPSLSALTTLWPTFSSYLISFFYVSVYWNRHRIFFRKLTNVDGAVFWANMHLLFWLSLLPFATGWVGMAGLLVVPTAVYGFSLLMVALAWNLVQVLIERRADTELRRENRLINLRGHLAPALYGVGIGTSMLHTGVAYGIYAAVAGLWLIPDRRTSATREWQQWRP